MDIESVAAMLSGCSRQLRSERPSKRGHNTRKQRIRTAIERPFLGSSGLSLPVAYCLPSSPLHSPLSSHLARNGWNTYITIRAIYAHGMESRAHGTDVSNGMLIERMPPPPGLCRQIPNFLVMWKLQCARLSLPSRYILHDATQPVYSATLVRRYKSIVSYAASRL